MYNPRSNHDQSMTVEKQIKIKPFSNIQKEQVKTTTPADALTAVHAELEKAQDELLQVKAEKKRLLKKIEKEINDAKANWEEEKSLLMKQAEQSGYKDGYEAGIVSGKQQYEQLIAEANDIIRKAEIAHDEKIKKSNEIILAIALKSAEKILSKQLSDDPSQFIHIVNAALKEIDEQSTILIYVHPKHYDLLMERKQDLYDILNGNTKLSIFIDHSLSEHGLRIEHPYGQIDASIDTQLERLRDALQELSAQESE